MKLWILTKPIITVNGMMRQRQKWITYIQYEVFKKLDKAQLDKQKKVINAPQGYHKIRVHHICAVKYGDRHNASLVADGH